MSNTPGNLGPSVAFLYLLSRLPKVGTPVRDALGQVLAGNAVGQTYARELWPEVQNAPENLKAQVADMIRNYSPQDFRMLVTQLYSAGPSPYRTARSIFAGGQYRNVPFIGPDGSIILPRNITVFGQDGVILATGDQTPGGISVLADGETFAILPPATQTAMQTGPKNMGNSVNPVQYGFVANLTSQQIAAANPQRRLLVLQNRSTLNDMYARFNGTATLNTGILIPAGGNFVFDNACPASSISVIASVATVPGILVEG